MIRDFPSFIDRSYSFLQYDVVLFCGFGELAANIFDAVQEEN